MARRLLVIARNASHPDREAALGMLGLFKVAPEDIEKPGVGEEVEKMINRHLQHV